jgi:hypothetical protein
MASRILHWSTGCMIVGLVWVQLLVPPQRLQRWR